MASSQAVVRRALLYGNIIDATTSAYFQVIDLHLDLVPASSERMLAKSRELNVDCVAYDLEDSVRSKQKSGARQRISKFLAQPRPQNVRATAVRMWFLK